MTISRAEELRLVRAWSAEHLYHLPTDARSPALHRCWQAPLLEIPERCEVTELHDRIRQAGRLWLQNHDLSSDVTLVLTAIDPPASFVFQRSTCPNHRPLELGPIAALEPSSRGVVLGAVVYDEGEDAQW